MVFSKTVYRRPIRTNMPRELPSPGQIGPDHQSTTLLEDTLRRLLCEGFTSTLGVAAAKDKGKAVRIAVASPDCNVVSHCILPSLAHALAQIKAVLTEEIFIWSEDKSQAPNTELQAPNTGSLALMPKDTSRDDMAARAMRLARRGLAAAAAEPASSFCFPDGSSIEQCAELQYVVRYFE